MYFIRSPWFLKKLYPGCEWTVPGDDPVLYLTFDDGPHEEATEFVLEELKKYHAKATFFCIGKNVSSHPALYERILMEGHSTGNHTYDHLNGWKVSDEEYIQNILKAEKLIDSSLFRPPYGKLSRFQLNLLTGKISTNSKVYRVIMWDVLSGDFDTALTAEACTQNVLKYSRKGSIITFHDSQKAFPRMKVALPELLKVYSERGYLFKKMS